MHRLWIEAPPSPAVPTIPIRNRPGPFTAGETITLTGEEALHAVRVKRLAPGEDVELLDGRGNIASAQVIEPPEVGPNATNASRRRRDPEITLRIQAARVVEPLSPMLELCTATPKGGRVDELVDQLSQLGAFSWRPMRTQRGVVDPRPTKIERLHRVARESAKQCGRAWELRIQEQVAFADACTLPLGQTTPPLVLLADATGQPLSSVLFKDASNDFSQSPPRLVRLLIGPEGGFTPAELAMSDAAGVRRVRLGPCMMRIETAAAAGCAIVLQNTQPVLALPEP